MKKIIALLIVLLLSFTLKAQWETVHHYENNFQSVIGMFRAVSFSDLNNGIVVGGNLGGVGGVILKTNDNGNTFDTIMNHNEYNT